MNVDTSLIMAARPADLLGAYNTGQKTALDLATARRQAEFETQRNPQIIAQNQLQLEENQRRASFEKWDNSHELTQDPVTGEIDIQKYLSAANQAGHGKYAREAVAELTRVKSAMTGEASGQRAQIQKILIDTANGMQGMPQYPMQPQGMPQGMGQSRDSYQNTLAGTMPQQAIGDALSLYTPQYYQQKPQMPQMATQAGGQMNQLLQGRRGTIMPQQPMPQPMGMGARATGSMPPPSADLQAAIAQLTAGRNSGTLPQGDTFQNNRNRQPTTLQGTFNSLRALGARGR